MNLQIHLEFRQFLPRVRAEIGLQKNVKYGLIHYSVALLHKNLLFHRSECLRSNNELNFVAFRLSGGN
jgi:hypothetical protein